MDLSALKAKAAEYRTRAENLERAVAALEAEASGARAAGTTRLVDTAPRRRAPFPGRGAGVGRKYGPGQLKANAEYYLRATPKIGMRVARLADKCNTGPSCINELTRVYPDTFESPRRGRIRLKASV